MLRYVSLLTMPLFFAACGSGEKTMSESTMNARIDSMVGEQTKDLIRQSEEDLDRRMAIEVKGKADSIVASRAAGVKVADTAKVIRSGMEP